MSETLTRAEVEKHLETARKYAKANALGSLIDSNHLIALCNMALRYLAMQPRPISEAPQGVDILAISEDRRTFYVSSLSSPPTDYKFAGSVKFTHFIPLSSLPEPKG